LKEEALDCTMWRAHFGRGFGPVVRQTTKWMNEYLRKVWFKKEKNKGKKKITLHCQRKERKRKNSSLPHQGNSDTDLIQKLWYRCDEPYVTCLDLQKLEEVQCKHDSTAVSGSSWSQQHNNSTNCHIKTHIHNKI